MPARKDPNAPRPVMHWGDTSHLKVPRPAREDSTAIARKRIENNLTQTQLAEKIGVSVTSVSSWEQGKRQPGRASLIKLSEALHCTVDELLR